MGNYGIFLFVLKGFKWGWIFCGDSEVLNEWWLWIKFMCFLMLVIFLMNVFKNLDMFNLIISKFVGLIGVCFDKIL